MAQRGEGQGLQIAVISFAILAIVLAGMSFFFFSSAKTAQKDLEAKNKTVTDQQQQINKLMYKVDAMSYVLGVDNKVKEDLEVSKSKAGGDDPKVKELLDTFASDIALVGDQAGAEGTKNYHKFTEALLTALNKKNASAADAMEQSKNAEKARMQVAQDEKARADAAAAAAEKAAADYNTQSQTFAADRAKIEEEQSKYTTQLTSIKTDAKTSVQKATDEKEAILKQNATLRATNQRLVEELDKYRKQLTGLKEQPDGHIMRVDQRLRMVWIDIGSADGLLRQTTFAIFDHNENGLSSTKRKGRIEVINVEEHLSEARILEDMPSNPIISGDIIETPAWSPGQRIHFALAMKMDINKDGVDDYDLVKSIILMNGGLIDAELRPDGTRIGNVDPNTRYFVVGDRPNEMTSKDVQNKFNAFDQDRANLSIPKIQVNELLAMMGWKAEERTVELAGHRGGTVGQPQAKKAANGKAGEAAAPAAESAAPAADPFGSPATAAPAPAAAPVDPFAPAAPAAPAADPFAPK
jgi:hypothetical protein